MAGKKKKNTAKTAAIQNETSDKKKVTVLCRFDREDLDFMRDDTGTVKDATAVACFVRKNMKK